MITMDIFLAVAGALIFAFGCFLIVRLLSHFHL